MHRISSIAFPSFAAICGFAVAQADAAVIGIDDFSGNETVIGFDTQFTGIQSKTFGDVTVTMLTPGDHIVVNHINWGSFFDNLSDYSGGHAATTSGQVPSFRIDFTTPVKRAGLALANTQLDYSWTVSAFDADGAKLAEDVFTRPDDEYSVFAGFEFSTPIAWLEVFDSGVGDQGTVFDDIRYESIPEPASVVLLSLGGLMMFPRRRRI